LLVELLEDRSVPSTLAALSQDGEDPDFQFLVESVGTGYHHEYRYDPRLACILIVPPITGDLPNFAKLGAEYTIRIRAFTEDPRTEGLIGYRIRWGDGTDTGFIAGSPSMEPIQHVYTALGYSVLSVDLYFPEGIRMGLATHAVRVMPYEMPPPAPPDPEVTRTYLAAPVIPAVEDRTPAQSAPEPPPTASLGLSLTLPLIVQPLNPNPPAGVNASIDTRVPEHSSAAVPDLRVTHTRLPVPIAPGRVATYTITVANRGSEVSNGAFVTFQLPTAMNFVAAGSTPGWEQTGPREFRSPVGTLDVNESLQVVFRTKVLARVAPGKMLTTLAGIGDDGLNDPDSDGLNNVFRLRTRVKR
jgi:uncharacterized repeat protein (TIGR01451 family)